MPGTEREITFSQLAVKGTYGTERDITFLQLAVKGLISFISVTCILISTLISDATTRAL
jgi:hypothetical protein